ncbi:MAG TPA: hypothetical protein VIL36_19230 [Acidimicrobiales bacterium]
MTVDPPARVAAVLAPLRAVADEVVVAVDDRVDPATLGPVEALADTVLRFTFAPPVDRPRAWLAAQCTGEWLLSIDGDEVASAALVDALPELVAARDVQQYHVPRRWLYPDPDRFLAELPWWPDFQLRLARNDATLAVRGGTHAGIVPVLPSRHVDLPLYHLDLVLRTEGERAAKAAGYEAEAPGRQAYGGGPLNATLYLPERLEGTPRPSGSPGSSGSSALVTEPVPAADAAAIAAVLAADRAASGSPPANGGPDPVAGTPVAGPPGQPTTDGRLPDDAYRVGWTPLYGDRRMAPGEVRPVYVRVENQGSAVWPWGLDQPPEIRVSYHWWTPGGDLVDYEGHRSPLPCRLGPGESTIVPVWVQAPAEPGAYVLELDLVHEHVRWFDAPLRIDMQVADRVTGAHPRC